MNSPYRYLVMPLILITVIKNCCFRYHHIVENRQLLPPSKLNFVEKLVMSYSGLRGAIAFALVLLIDPARLPGE